MRAPRGVHAGPSRASAVWWAAALGLGALLAVVAMGYDADLVGRYYLPRFVPLYPLICALLILTLVVRRRGTTPAIDALDLLALMFAVWQVLSAVLSPSAALAWFGYYNRGTGALFWIGMVLVFVAARRVLDRRRGRQVLTWCVALVLLVAGLIALAQMVGASSLWGGAVVNGRVSGPTGNPTNLAGLGLLGVWLLAGLPSWPRRSATQIVALIGVAGAAGCVVLSVSRAAYLGVAAGLAVLVVAWIRERRRRALMTLGCACAVGLVVIVGYGLAAGGGASLLSRLGGDLGGLTRSDSLRVALWREGVAGVAWRPLVGAGSGSFVIVDRKYRAAEDRRRQPWVFASDPHSAPLLVASTSGVPGLLLAVAFAALIVWVVWPWRRVTGSEGSDPRLPPPSLRVAGLSYLAAVFVFLLVSPLDLVVAVPVVLVGAATCGAPVAESALTWQLPARIGPSWRTVIGLATALLVCAALVFSLVEGIRWYRADLAFAKSVRAGSPTGLAEAASMWSWEPLYSLEAGAQTWRAGLSAEDAADVGLGRALVRQGLRRDPTDALGYADLARLHIAQGRLTEAVDELRAGLRANPHHCVLQGLWGYAALVAQSKMHDEALADRLLAGLRRLPADTPDAWYWTSRTLAAQGDSEGAAVARARARKLAPLLSDWRYGQRLLKTH